MQVTVWLRRTSEEDSVGALGLNGSIINFSEQLAKILRRRFDFGPNIS